MEDPIAGAIQGCRWPQACDKHTYYLTYARIEPSALERGTKNKCSMQRYVIMTTMLVVPVGIFGRGKSRSTVLDWEQERTARCRLQGTLGQKQSRETTAAVTLS